MDKVFFLTQKASDIPADLSWLTQTELAVSHGFLFEKRRNDWLLGRWTAKQAILRFLGLDQGRLPDVEILAAADGAPLASIHGDPREISVSISHSSSRAVCAIDPSGTSIGCDIELVQQRDSSFTETFLTEQEQLWAQSVPAALQPLVVTLIWSAKESVLKATHEGLRADTWSINVNRTDLGQATVWQALTISKADNGTAFHGWWRHKAGFVFTIAAEQELDSPASLAQVNFRSGTRETA